MVIREDGVLFCKLSAQRHLCQLLDGLLELQSTLSSRMSQQKGGVAREGVVSPGDAASSDEEVPSDEEEKGERRGEAMPPLLGPQRAAAFKRKRPRSWESSGGRDYAEEIAREYETLRPYRNDIISKWNEKTKLATGKITSKVGVAATSEAVLMNCFLFLIVIYGSGPLDSFPN